ncbi:RNA ligase [Embleya sp. NPDC005971]|uniref:RNA ligase n=1 Tax=Embleya sp. NPDC005971 TaxID=3156724 RepID=UPI0033C1A338
MSSRHDPADVFVGPAQAFGKAGAPTPVTLSPLHLSDLFPLADLEAEIASGYVTRKPHPELPLAIYTYAPTCQFENRWNPVTMRCRGLVADDDGRIVALPFPKIFLVSMHGQGHEFAPPLPAGRPFEVYDKADGSLAITFHYAGRWHVATKGSFASTQALWAQAHIDTADTCDLDPDITYLAEIIYPENRIVVDYGDRKDLVLLGAYRPTDGTEPALADVAPHWARIGSVVRSWGTTGYLGGLEAMAAANQTVKGDVVSGIAAEGFVVRFASGLRAKIKFADYLALHKLYTGTSERTIWEALAAGRDIGELFDRIPDEFRDWVHGVADRLTAQADAWIRNAVAAYTAIGTCPDRRTFADRAKDSPYRAALFMLLDDRDIRPLAWKQVRPSGALPFTAADPQE